MPPLITKPLDTGVERTGSLLSPIAYDDDAVSLHSRSDQDTDSEDDELVARARNSRELRARDRMLLMEEEEMDKLVIDSRAKQERQRRGSGLVLPNPLRILRNAGSSPSRDPFIEGGVNSSTEDLQQGRRNKRRMRRKEKRDRLLKEAQEGEDGMLMYEMESGGIKDGSSTGDSSEREDSDDIDRKHLLHHSELKANKRRRWKRWLLIYSLIIVGFAFLALLAWKISVDKKRAGPPLLTNGTALFAPTTIIFSLDGFRADFLQRGLSPRLDALVKEGVSPLYMNPSFPSVTFPNHYTLATGLYPESHGIVGNSFWDPSFQAEFYYTDPSRSMDPKWWGGDPFWVTAEEQGVRTAVHMWPGSEAHILKTEPSFVDKFNSKEKLSNKVARILEFLDKPGLEDSSADIQDMRPQLIAAYVPNVDADGHKYGPNSTEIRSTISEVDTMLDQIFTGLEERNLTDIVNIIVVSDHGMATTDISRMIQLEDLVDLSKVDHVDGWPLVGIRPKDEADIPALYEQALAIAGSNPNFEVYLRDKNMPERYHFSKNDRIAPLWIIPKTGWAIVRKEEFDIEEGKKKGLVYHPRGLHGYDHEHPLMRAIFIARGPAFPHQPNSKLAPFQNIEVYNILCDSVGIKPIPNNGTLRLPLSTIGLHDSETTIEELKDPETIPSSPELDPTGVLSISPIEASSAADENLVPPQAIGVDPVNTINGEQKEPTPLPPPPPPPPADDNGDKDNEAGDKDPNLVTQWWDWITGKIGDIWDHITTSDDDSSSG
ncbi:alkaline-phosphatase-like protein [Xylariales sp. PMI_506]|nr:alkaline-phosphatase-like protein [Xylariales sp. PMI_506]